MRRITRQQEMRRSHGRVAITVIVFVTRDREASIHSSALIVCTLNH